MADIVQRIDDTVRSARLTHCACGCGRPLDDRSPSLYYASQECQSTVMRSQATDALRVETRPDVSYLNRGAYPDSPAAAATGLPVAAPGRPRGRPGWQHLSDTERGQVCDFLRANELDPTRIPIDCDIITTTGTVTVTMVNLNEGGDPIWVPSAERQGQWDFVGEQRTVPLRVPWPAGLRYAAHRRATASDQISVTGDPRRAGLVFGRAETAMSDPDSSDNTGRQVWINPREPIEDGANYGAIRARRYCPVCAAHTELAVTAVRTDAIGFDTDGPAAREPVHTIRDARQCERCGYRHAVAVDAQWRRNGDPPGWYLRVIGAGGLFVGFTVTDERLARMRDPQDYLARLWGRLIDELVAADQAPP